jgi:phage baseplate assembly protein gpV
MLPRIGERVLVGSAHGGEVREAVVVGHDTAGNPQTIPVEAAASEELLERHLGVAQAMAVRARVLDELVA